MSNENEEYDKYESNQYQKLLPINSPDNKQNFLLSSSSIDSKEFRSSTSSRLSLLSNTSTETTKSELIQRILDSFKPPLNCKSSSDNTTNSSLSFLNPSQSLNLSNKIYVHFKDENELGMNPQIDDLLEKIEDTKKCSCHRVEINFNNQVLNQQLSYKQKQSVLRIILRRQQIFDRYFS